MNEALLSDSVDVGSGGVGPLLLIWDRTNGDVKGIAAINSMPLMLNSNDPELQTLEDFGPDDKIAVPAAGVSIQARVLQMAAAAAARQLGCAREQPGLAAAPRRDGPADLAGAGHLGAPDQPTLPVPAAAA